jgi:cobaltochelatase CobS
MLVNLKEKKDTKQLFDLDFEIEGFPHKSDLVPDIDENYVFDHITTKAILMGFKHNHRVLIQGYHGTGKSTHVEQVAARLNWPCMRVNLDGHITRSELIGRDAIIIKEGKQVTEFKEGIIPWALEKPIALIIDEYDAGRPDVMFVIQRLLEAEGKLTLLEQNKVIFPHNDFRLFATANTIGLGDATGLYHGTHPINQGQLDRWNIIVNLDFMDNEKEIRVVSLKVPKINRDILSNMINFAHLTRQSFLNGDVNVFMSTRNLINWAQNFILVGDLQLSYLLSFLNKCDPNEKLIYDEFYQRCFGV